MVLSVRLADDGKCHPWTDVIADEVAASGALSELDLKPKGPGTHELLSLHIPLVYADQQTAASAAATTHVPLRSPRYAVLQPATPAAATPTAASALNSWGTAAGPLSPSQQAVANVAQRFAGQGRTSSASGIRTPGRLSPHTQQQFSQAAQQAEHTRAAVTHLVANAISAVNRAHEKDVVPSAGVPDDAAAAAAAAAEEQRQIRGHGPFVGVPIKPIAGAYSVAILVRHGCDVREHTQPSHTDLLCCVSTAFAWPARQRTVPTRCRST